MVKKVRTSKTIYLSFFLFVFLIPSITVAERNLTIESSTTLPTGPLSEYTGSLQVNQISGNVVLPGNVSYPLGTACTSNSQCASGYCVHGFCRSSSTYCGDSHCDSGETCSNCASDCGSCLSTVLGGGGGVSTGGVQGGTEITISSVPAGTTKNINIADSFNLSVTNIIIDDKNALHDAKISITQFSTPPSGAPTTLGKAYIYIEIKTENINCSDLNNVKIDFKVSKSWLKDNNFTASDVVLERYYNGNWNELTTNKVSEDAYYVYFESTSPCFSVFAIVGKAAVVPVLTTTSKPVTTVVSTTVTKTTTKSLIPPLPAVNSVVIVGITLIVIVIAVIVWIARKPINPRATHTTFQTSN